MNDLARILITSGMILIAVGVCLLAFGKIPAIGRLPGDILIKKGDATFYFPLTTCILLSAILSAVMYLWNQK